MTSATKAPADRRDRAARLLAAVVIGIMTGLVVLALEHLVDDLIHEVFEAPVWVPAVVVVAGAVLTAVVIRYVGGRTTASTEVYVEQFHHTDPDMDLEHAPGRVVGSFTTLASGAPPRSRRPSGLHRFGGGHLHSPPVVGVAW
jgi:H+/Cl- antiporter ClcA